MKRNSIAWFLGLMLCSSAQMGRAAEPGIGAAAPRFTFQTLLARGTNFTRKLRIQGQDIWLATTGGLMHSRDRGTTWTAFNTEDGLAGNTVTALLLEGTTVYAGTEQGLSISTDQGQHWTNFTKAGGLADSKITSLFRAADGALWIGTDGGLNRSKFEGNSLQGVGNIHLPGSSIENIAQGPDGSIWATFSSLDTPGLVFTRDNGQTWSTVDIPDKLGGENENPAKALFFDSAGVLWVSTWVDGLYRSPDLGKTWTRFAPGVYGVTKDSFVNAFYEYPRGTLWIGTQGNIPSGISMTRDSGTTWTKRNNLCSSNILGLAADEEGRLYASTSGCGISWTDDEGASWSSRETALGIPDNTITAVSKGPEGSIWIGTQQAYAAYSKDGGKEWVRLSWPGIGLLSKKVQQIWFDAQATPQTLWISTGSGLYRTSNWGASFDVFSTANGLGADDVRGIFKSEEGGRSVIWAATGSGSHIGPGGVSQSIDGGNSWRNFPRDDQKYGSNDTKSVFVDAKGVVWAATRSGLRHSEDGGQTWVTWFYRPVVGMPANAIYAVSGTGDHSLWLAVDRFVSDPDAPAISVARTNDFGNSWTLYNSSSGAADSGGRVLVSDASRGLVFLGTDRDGMFWTPDDGGSWSRATTNQGLGANTILGISCTDSGQILVATSMGLSIGSSSSLDDRASVRHKIPARESY